MDSSMELKMLGMVLVVLALFGSCATACENEGERRKCASLQKQGVKAYVAEALISVECVVLQRDLNLE